ncbi:MAG: HD domain-containing protein [Mesotoga sp.]|nr:HD domain-containing protein [Mesotoga sp.]NLI07084.1 HD domain-containing protein [Thermotogaceae bacterium]HON28391.1 HD domain-containing protein [Mesotoga infera]
MKGFSELRFAGPKLVFVVFLIMFSLMFLPFHVFQSEAVVYTQRVYSEIYQKAVDALLTTLSIGYFQWNAMFNAFETENMEFIDSMFEEILNDISPVRSIDVIERPKEFSIAEDYELFVANEELYAYMNVRDSLANNTAEGFVVMVSIDKHRILESLSMADRISFSNKGDELFAYGLHVDIKGYDLYNWLVFHAFISGLIGVLLMMEVLAIAFSRYHQTQGLQTTVYMWELQDPYTTYHSKNVAKIAEILGKRLKLKRKKLAELVNGAKLHDIGKMGISTSILRKRGPLNEIEWEVMLNHPERGKNLLEQFKYLGKYVPYAYMHHEREDGSGYPLGLKGEEIPFEVKILAVADVFEALTADRPYRDAYTFAEAAEMMTEMPLDQKIVSELFKALPELEEELSDRGASGDTWVKLESDADELVK